jgi:hypothetical protein
MDAWNAAQLILDITFGVAITITLVTFIYLREKRIRKLVANYVVGQAEQVQTETVNASATEAAPLFDHGAGVPSETSAHTPPLLARYQPGHQAIGTGNSGIPKSPVMSRTEKYLEAVRMYRDGRRREEIESRLGISFMELELLAQLK